MRRSGDAQYAGPRARRAQIRRWRRNRDPAMHARPAGTGFLTKGAREPDPPPPQNPLDRRAIVAFIRSKRQIRTSCPINGEFRHAFSWKASGCGSADGRRRGARRSRAGVQRGPKGAQLDRRRVQAKGQEAETGRRAGATAAKPSGKPGGDRQFGELEGWSPGKEPPKAEKKDETPKEPSRGPVGITPSGNMSVGLPF